MSADGTYWCPVCTKTVDVVRDDEVSADGTYWCPVCTKTVDVVRDDEGKRCFAEHTNTAGEPCLTSGLRNGWDDRP